MKTYNERYLISDTSKKGLLKSEELNPSKRPNSVRPMKSVGKLKSLKPLRPLLAAKKKMTSANESFGEI